MKKLLAVVLAVAMLLGMVSIASADDVQEITWMFWDDLEASSDLITQGFKQVIDRFNADYAGKYHVTPITTQLEPYYTDLNALVDAQKTPDVFIVSPGPELHQDLFSCRFPQAQRHTKPIFSFASRNVRRNCALCKEVCKWYDNRNRMMEMTVNRLVPVSPMMLRMVWLIDLRKTGED